MHTSPDPLIGLLQSPERLTALAPGEWHPVLTLARRSGLIGTLAARSAERQLLETLPEAARDALVGGLRLGDHHDGMLRWEAGRVRRALADCGEPAVLLKGAAYATLGLPSSRGRLTGDIDILVRRAALPRVEASLLAHGWEPTEEDDYNQRYYRRYMHELPPLRHRERGTVVDVHHTISPPTSRIKIDGETLWPRTRATGLGGLLVLGPADMVLHAMIHLFHEGSIERGLRDLVDIDGLLRHFASESGFWDELVARADAAGAGRVVFYALRYAALFLATPLPEPVLTAARRWSPPAAVVRLMDAAVVRALMSYRGDAGPATRLANRLLYVRSHWRRMPPHQLGLHLLRKLLMRRRAAAEPAEA